MRVSLEPAYLLHRRPFRDSSQLLELFTVNHGRVALMGRGLTRKRHGGALGAILQPFRPLLVSFSGRGDMQTLTAVESGGELAALQGDALLSGFYLNELLLRLLHRHDAQQLVFAAYGGALGELAGLPADASLEPALRRFEFAALDALGYGIDLRAEIDSHDPLVDEDHYQLVPERGLKRCHSPDKSTYPGADLVAIGRGDYEAAPVTAKRLVRNLLEPHLGDRPLNTRNMFERAPSQPDAGAA